MTRREMLRGIVGVVLTPLLTLLPERSSGWGEVGVLWLGGDVIDPWDGVIHGIDLGYQSQARWVRARIHPDGTYEWEDIGPLIEGETSKFMRMMVLSDCHLGETR